MAGGTKFIGFALLMSLVTAFPHAFMDHLMQSGEIFQSQRNIDPSPSSSLSSSSPPPPPPQGAGFFPSLPPPFDAANQLVSTTGVNAFVAPGPGDARGECPGLNALANHGYIPHNGIATIAQFTEATQKVFGMGTDLALFLAVYGAVLDGSLAQWSIGGTPHVGIGGSHGNYESDSSPLKSDLHQYGTNGKLVMSQFNRLYSMQPDARTANYNLDVLRTFRKVRFQESIQKNPLFYSNDCYPIEIQTDLAINVVYSDGPFSGQLVSQAAFTFIYRFMANKSRETPEGVLNKDVLKSFMSIRGPEDNLTWVPGHERIPDNWYKRNPLDEYGIVYLNLDVVNFALEEPSIILPGCNNGQVNTFNAIDPSVISRGTYTLQQALKSPVCFSLEVLKAEVPRLTGLTTSLLNPLFGVLADLTSTLQCTPIYNVNTSPLAICPGFGLYGGPTGSVAPGAIQT